MHKYNILLHIYYRSMYFFVQRKRFTHSCESLPGVIPYWKILKLREWEQIDFFFFRTYIWKADLIYREKRVRNMLQLLDYFPKGHKCWIWADSLPGASTESLPHWCRDPGSWAVLCCFARLEAWTWMKSRAVKTQIDTRPCLGFKQWAITSAQEQNVINLHIKKDSFRRWTEIY